MARKASVPVLKPGSKIERVYEWLLKKCAATGYCHFTPDDAQELARKFDITHGPNVWRFLRDLAEKRLIKTSKTPDPGFIITIRNWKPNPSQQAAAMRDEFSVFLAKIETRLDETEKMKAVSILQRLDRIARTRYKLR